MSIHPSAQVAAGAQVDPSAEVGPFCVVGPQVRLGSRVQLLAHVVVAGHTELGADCRVHPFASLGGPPQDKKYRDEPGRLMIGAGTVIREGVTCNIGTAGGEMETRIGPGCLLMAYAHVAHDCRLGQQVVLANSVSLAGHVQVGDFVIMGGLAAVHQFCRIGDHAFIGGGAMVANDVPPYCIAQGDRAELAGLNVVGLKRAALPHATLMALHRTYARIFRGAASRAAGLATALAAPEMALPEVAHLCAQVAQPSRRGVAASRRRSTHRAPDSAIANDAYAGSSQANSGPQAASNAADLDISSGAAPGSGAPTQRRPRGSTSGNTPISAAP